MMTKDFQAKWRDEFVEHATNKKHRFIPAWLHTALGKEKGGRTKHALRAIVPMTLINTVKVFDKLFRVDDCGMFLSSPSRFDSDLFRSLSYSEFKKWAGALEIGSSRTFRRNVAKLREIGVLETISNRQDDQGRWGEWKVRVNPFKIGFWVGATFSTSESCVRAEVPSPAATDGLLFSLTDSPLPAVASQPPVVANSQPVPRSKKKVLEPGGSRPSSENTEAIIRKNILATETGPVVEILKAVYPDLTEAPVTLLKRVHNQVEAWMDSRRLTPGKARALVQMVENEPESLEGFARLKTFQEVLKFWPKINQILRKWMLSDYDGARIHEKARLAGIVELLSDPNCQPTAYMSPENVRILEGTRTLIKGLQRGDNFDSLFAIAEPIRNDFINVPLTYSTVVEKFKLARHVIALPARVHRQLSFQTHQYRAKLEAWDAVKWRYGY